MCVYIYIWRYYRGESKCVIKACRTYIMIDNTIRIMRVCHARLFTIHLMLQPIPLGVTFSNAVSKLKAQSSNVSFHRNVAKETFELWALSFRTWHPKWDWLYIWKRYVICMHYEEPVNCVLCVSNHSSDEVRVTQSCHKWMRHVVCIRYEACRMRLDALAMTGVMRWV